MPDVQYKPTSAVFIGSVLKGPNCAFQSHSVQSLTVILKYLDLFQQVIYTSYLGNNMQIPLWTERV